MPSRPIPFINGQFYHVYNRGSEKRRIFEDRREYVRFLKALKYYQLNGPKLKFSLFSQIPKTSEKIVDIIAYCLMPNHFHLIVKQLKENGITELMSKLSNSYTKYFNTKHERVGPLFQGEFKSVFVENDEQLIHLSRYIHLNPLVSFLVKDLSQYEWSSYKEYLKQREGICNINISSFFKSVEDYKQFVLDHADYAKRLEMIKHQTIDEDFSLTPQGWKRIKSLAPTTY